jgi:DnaK suppressor protein
MPAAKAKPGKVPAVPPKVAAPPVTQAAKASVIKPVASAKLPAKAAASVPAKAASKPVAAPAMPVLPQSKTTKPVAKASAAVVPKSVAVAAKPSVAAPALAPVPPVAAAPATRRGRKPAGPALPTPQPQPSHSPDAAKATFSHLSERVMTLPVHSPVRKDPKLANNWKTKPLDQLTDEEVLAMPDAEYMNETQMAFFRRKLVGLKEDILANAGETTEHLREDTVVVPDPADRATIEEEHALELRTRDRERKLLKKIDQSIARIDSGDYGYCDETGEAIGVGRLLARPTASLSLEAQQRRELKQKMFGD